MLDNLNTVLESVSKWGLDQYVVNRLHIPQPKQRELQQQYPIVAQRKRAYSTYYLAHHPGPSWRIIATALYYVTEFGALELVQKLYLKGEPCADSCRSEGRIGSLCIPLCAYYSLNTVCCFVCVHCKLPPTM